MVRQEINMAYGIKAEIHDPQAGTYTFIAQKTMYGGKQINEGDMVFVFASEKEGGRGLIARGIVISSERIPKKPGVTRQTPCRSIIVKRSAFAKRLLGRGELNPFTNWYDMQPQTELNFKLYRQATDKIVGITNETEAYLEEFF
jgi:hypothetical protein